MTNPWLTRFYMVLSLMGAMVLETLELGWGNYAWLSPSWVFVLVIYWVVYYPQLFGMGAAWFSGLLLDVWTTEPLGKHALLFLIASFIINFSYNNFDKQSPIDKLWIVGIMLFLYNLVLLLINLDFSIFLSLEGFKFLGTVLSSTILWFLLSEVAKKREQQINLR